MNLQEFWYPLHWDIVDSSNNAMWRLSPLLAWRIHDHTMLQTPGHVGRERGPGVLHWTR